MSNSDLLFVGLIAVGVMLLGTSAYAGYVQLTDDNGTPIFDDVTGEPIMISANESNDTLPVSDTESYAAPEQRINAFLAMIREFESGNDYTVLYGNTHFTDMSKHPYEGKPLPKHSAAGAYQFIIRTWLALKNQLGLTDFSPSSQDAAAYELLRQIGAIDALTNDNFDLALRKASSQWASLPYSTAGQNPKSIQAALASYTSNIG